MTCNKHRDMRNEYKILVRIALGYGLDDRGLESHRSGAHPASYPMGNMGSFPWGKTVGA